MSTTGTFRLGFGVRAEDGVKRGAEPDIDMTLPGTRPFLWTPTGPECRFEVTDKGEGWLSMGTGGYPKFQTRARRTSRKLSCLDPFLRYVKDLYSSIDKPVP